MSSAVSIMPTMDKDNAVFKIITGEYLNYVGALSIKRDDLIAPSNITKKLHKLVNATSESLFANYYDFIDRQVSSNLNYTAFTKSVDNAKSPFGKFTTLLCIYAVCDKFIENNPSSKEKTAEFLQYVITYLTNDEFANEVSTDQKFLDFVNSCVKESTFNNKNKSNIIAFSTGALLVGGLVAAYFICK